ncbi:MAG: hypothetical protein U0930_16755 [Pirellulales bacterium]
MITVVKLGGSLLDLPDLSARWIRFLDLEQLVGPILLIVGGGNIVESVRRYDAIHTLDSIQSHWLCVDLMNSTATLLGMLLKDAPVLTQVTQLENWLMNNQSAMTQPSAPRTTIVAPSAFYSRELRSDSLPQSWDTTSDSISALLAQLVGAERLILLKSTEPDSPDNPLHGEPLLDEAFRKSFVDMLNWRTVNLRAQKYDG